MLPQNETAYTIIQHNKSTDKRREYLMVSTRSLLAYLMADEAKVIYFIFCCVIVLMLSTQCKQRIFVELRNKVVFPAILLLIFVPNPVSAHLFVSSNMETQSLRFIWLIPTTILLSCVTVLLIYKFCKRWERIIAAGMMSIAIFACGKSIASIKSVWTWNTPNWYKVPQSVVELCDYIMSDSSIESKVVAFPFPLNLWVRQYQPGIIMPFAWDVTECQDLHDAMEEDPINLDHVSSLAADFGCTYVVLQADANYIGCMEDYIEIWRIDLEDEINVPYYNDEYILYRVKEEKCNDLGIS